MHLIKVTTWPRIVLLALFTAALCGLFAQTPAGRPTYRSRTFEPDTATAHTQAFGAIAKSARDLAKKRARDLPEATRHLVQIEKDATFLQKQVLQWVNKNRGGYPGPPPEFDPYFQDLRRIAKALDKAAKRDDKSFTDLVRSVSLDLRAKAENCRLSVDGLGKQITVTARTLQGTNELPGFEVYFAPMALLDDKAEHDKFPTLSSPTTLKNFPPGYYAVWLKRNTTTNTHSALTIGGDGSQKFTFDISVPEVFDSPP